MVCRPALFEVAASSGRSAAGYRIFRRGVAAGVATLVIALAMNTGFRETLQDRLLGVTAHISLARPGSGGIRNYEDLIKKFADPAGSKVHRSFRLPKRAVVVWRRCAWSCREGRRSRARAEIRRGIAAHRGGQLRLLSRSRRHRSAADRQAALAGMENQTRRLRYADPARRAD